MDLKSEFNGENNGLQIQETGNQKAAYSDHQMNGFKYENGGNKSDCYIVDLENFSNGVDKEHNIHSATTTNSRITLQRSLSRKVPQRSGERKVNDRDNLATTSSPRAAQVASTPEKSVSHTSQPPMGPQDNTTTNHQQQPQHQITIKTAGINPAPDGRWGRKSSFKRPSYSCFADPKRILLFFATLSSMGTMLLIYFTLSMSQASDTESVIDWQ